MKHLRVIPQWVAGLVLSIGWLTQVAAGTLTDVPLSLKGGVPPNVMLDLSVEYPTANTAAYQGVSDYSVTAQYLGYFDSEKCYDYATSSGWFVPTGLANSHACNNWSGNFLNWATMTGLDEFRFAMTGGNRVQDTTTLTVLERSYQSGQGGTSNFPDKTFTENGNTTPFPSGTPLTIKNQGQGVQMSVYPNGVSVATCNTPAVSGGSFSCGSITLADGTTGTCTVWVGSGTLALPYRCTSFGTFGGVAPTSGTLKTTSSFVSGGGNNSVNCSNPGFAGSAFTCTLTLASNNHTGTCTTWSGNGSPSSPYTCSAFGTFSGNENFTTASSGSVTSTFSSNVVSGQLSENASCSFANSTLTVTCTLSNGDRATCNTYTLTSNKYLCTTWVFSGNETLVSSSRNGGNTTNVNGSRYYTDYTFTYTVRTVTNTSYTATYAGSTGTGVYYAATYDIAFGSAQTYNVRVKVCDSAIGLEDNCSQYGTTYKPTGSIQNNGDKMRFGVMSYFQASDVDNAVLRSKMKYVAPQKYSSSGGNVTNPNAEWSATDGTLLSNPDAGDSATTSSFIGSVSQTGVINYINKFGSNSHTYKTLDPVGKLYYESLKYLRGQSPTASFYNGAKASNSDGFPVITAWDNPIQYSCQKNYVIALADSHTWCDKRLPGGSFSGTGDANCNAYTDSNGNAHPDDKGSLSGDSGVNVTTSMNTVGQIEGLGNIATNYTGASNSSGSYAIAGLAQWAASSDIRPDLSGSQHVQSLIIDVQEYGDCGYQSQLWLAAKYGNPDSYDNNGNWLTSNNPAMGNITLGNCGYGAPPVSNGMASWPKNLLRAGDPLSLVASVKSALALIVAQIGDEAALSQSSGSLDTGTGAYIYRATYNSAGWRGDVEALSIDINANVANTPAWKASGQLPAPSARSIYTFNDGLQSNGSIETGSNARRGVAFTSAGFSSNLSSRQQAMLNTDEFGVTDSLGTDRIEWLRGDQSKEANLPGTTTPNTAANHNWRSRLSLLGDVINSRPIFVGKPAALNDPDYAAFVGTNASRKPMIYVGSNDGMLHAIDASYTVSSNGVPAVTSTSGKELFGYIPSAVFGNLNQLMGSNYSHKYYVDGTPVAGEAKFTNGGWKTMLVGGLNAGGQGIYALDITNPTTFDATKVLWEFTDRDDADLGYTFSQPIIRKMNNGRWAVIFGNGFNNTKNDGSVSSTGQAYLYILYVDGPGAGNTWTLNTNYFKIALTAPGTTGLQNPANGLASVSGIDKDLNGTVDIVYAGDRLGNLWKIDLSSSSTSNWKAGFGSVSSPLPLFTARTPTDTLQQITTGIEVGKNPFGGYMVMFGTGSYIDQNDALTPFSVDTMYGIWDKDDASTRVSSRSRLQKERVITSVLASGNTCTPGVDNCYSVLSKCEPNYTTDPSTATTSPLCPSDLVNTGSTQQFGWLFDLPTSGERIRSAMPRLEGNIVKFTTLTPASDPCTGNTVGYEYELSFLSGGAPTKPVYVLPDNPGSLINISIGGQTVAVAPAGHTIVGGASDNPLTFDARPPSTVVPVSASAPLPPTAPCVGTACQNYLPGWGFLMNLHGGTASDSKYVISCHPPQFGNGAPICEWKLKPGRFGRVGWKQISN